MIIPNTQRLFSYGTLQQDNVQQAIFGRTLKGTHDTLIGYKLGQVRITDPDVLTKSGKEFHPILVSTGDTNDSVDGMVFEVSEEELAHADTYEVDDYKRVSAQFKSGDTAWIYADAIHVNANNSVKNDNSANNHKQTSHRNDTNMSDSNTNDAKPEPKNEKIDSNSTVATPNHTPQLDAFTQVVESRRSVRIFKDTDIPKEVLTDCLRLAMLAPNSSNLQCWEFYVIDTPSKRKEAVKICMNQNAAKTANKLVAIVARTDNWLEHSRQILAQYPEKPVPKPVQDYYGKLIPVAFARGPANLLSIPKYGLIKAHRTFKGPIKTPIYNEHQLKTWAISNAYLAAENFMLALRAHGFDSCPMGGFDEPAMKKLLGLGDKHHIAMMIGAGERDDSGIYGEQFRFDFDKFVHHV